jgi:hypothetical protein
VGRRAGVAGRVDVCAKESHKKEEARGGDSTRPGQESRQTFLQLNFPDRSCCRG